MLRTYIKIALRNLLRRKVYAAMTLTGLAVGLTFALLTGSYLWGEYQVNRSLRNAERLYLVRSEWKKEKVGPDITTFAPLGHTLQRNYPNLVANSYRYDGISVDVSRGDRHFRESVQAGDSTLLTLTGLPLLHGDARTALTRPNSVVLTESRANRYFGRTNVLGQTLLLHNFAGGKQAYRVTGVLKELPENAVTHLTARQDEVFISLSSLKGRDVGNDSWANVYLVTYLELQPGVRPDQLARPIAQTLATHAPANLRDNVNVRLAPLIDYRFDANGGLIGKLVRVLAAVAVFILLMASINFINVSLGTSTTRLREIGVRKALGGARRQVLLQFLMEGLLLTGAASALALLGYEVARPAFGQALGKLLLPLFDWPGWAFGAVGGLSLVVGLLAGSYPALVLSGLPAVDSLKGKLRSVGEGIRLRRALLTIQFTMAVFIFVGAVVVGRQISYFFDKDLGFDQNQLLTISSVPRDWSSPGVDRMERLRDEFARVPGVSAASLSYEIPNGNAGNTANMYRHGRDSTGAISMVLLSTDQHYAQAYGLSLKAGHFLQATADGSDPDQIVLNESAARALGWQQPEDALGQLVRAQGAGAARRVVGITADFHLNSLHEAVRPVVFLHPRTTTIYRHLSLRIQPERRLETVAAVQKKWTELLPEAPFEYTFLDDTLQQLYESELRLQQAARIATVLALIIVLLGLQGVVSLSIARRTKEIGIRRVLGATSGSIVQLFLREFVGILLLANVLAAPMALWVLRNWLQNYAYSIGLDVTPFLLVGAILAVLIGTVVSLQVVKAALMNPLKSLRTE